MSEELLTDAPFRVAATLRLRHGRLTETLRRLGWNQHRLAVYLGVHDTTVSDWMRFKGRPPTDPDVLRKLMDLTGCAVMDLFPARICGAPPQERPPTEIMTIQEVSLTRLLHHGQTTFALPSAEALYGATERRDAVVVALATLAPKEQQILCLRFGLGGEERQTLEEIGQVFGLSPERTRQIESQALRKLKHPSRSAGLRQFAKEG